MAVPVIMRWCRKVGIAPSKVLMPVSISIILGGTISLIGTSTNLVVSGLAEADKTLLDLNGKRMKIDFFGISKVCGKSTQSCVDHQP
jgi:Na+/serine symporter